MLQKIIHYSLQHKLIILLFTLAMSAFGIYSLMNIPIGAVPDVTSNQVQIITTSRNLATQDVEKFITYPVELEMANLPGITEIRSVSKFGLSVVTVVFEDNLGTYLPRQLIAEKIKAAEEKIPASFGKPFMGPISTGLGEIYQYILDVDPKYKDQYSIMDLRTIQDWVVKRQLSGIPGVVEVNTWGGHLKQFEAAVNPEKLRAMGISLTEIYDALVANNSVAGGGYIEKTNQSYFIRGEGQLSSIEDIGNVVITNRDGMPIYVKDVAAIGFGSATRFGAITGNGEGEKVLGQVMMLKGANSKKVIEAVKARVDEISSSLPIGISINPVLERSELIGKTTFTIAENLILGCLIVIFVVVLLLGNLRSGLVVASVIPLSLLFALSLMYIFGVDANLMSLGAIDFGIIIDGAVIIVEYIAYKITTERTAIMALPQDEKQSFIDKITLNSADKMMHSAVFGQLIIIIVFIPILALVGVEGKMFRPMALVFCFALIGAMLLCFTYVPVMAALFLKPSKAGKSNISDKLIGFIQKLYQPTIVWALKSKKIVLSLATALLVLVIFIFSRMGGEFVPTLDEGDFVIQPVLKTGTSLSKTIETTTRIEQILLTFPEVDQVVTRIGAAEVPTDPMSMEESDVIIKLHPKKLWSTAKTKDELADHFKEALSIIPGVDYEFTQPIEMRFNELITGVRADLAIKIFGEDLDVLYNKALEISEAVKNVEGAADITVEKIVGLPQMSVHFDRQKMAKYGVNIEQLNQVISIGFAGLPAGSLFEGEKQFNLVVRYDAQHRKDINNLERASIELPNGQMIPLSEFATISYTKGPAKISRDNTKRRVVVGINVRNRDLESVVSDVQTIINNQVKMPAGYTVDYGGQFENLRTAKERLMIAVPIALILIFILLYFAFDSVRDALMIYSAIPLSTVGGILLLYLRGMPFSISAGVGFIALFGIAVLNGIVLIEHFKSLKKHGMDDINERIITGTQQRLRPVLLTATAAALGFLPMALSGSAGAEVQRPLATVVVGGLISATLLTLIVLPVLYAIFDNVEAKKKRSITPVIIIPFFMLLPLFGHAQNQNITVDQAIAIAIENNQGLQAATKRMEASEQLVGTSFNLNKTEIFYNYDENNIAENGLAIRVYGINQSLQFPTVYGAQKRVLQGQANLARQQYNLQELQLTKQVAKAYYEVVYWQQVLGHYQYLDSLYAQFAIAAQRRYELGETNYLEKLTATAKQQEMHVRLTQHQENISKSYTQLNQWLQTDQPIAVADSILPILELLPFQDSDHPGLSYYQEYQQVAQQQMAYEKQLYLPDLNFSLFQGTNNGVDAKRYRGFTAGIGIPLWYGANKAKVKATKTSVQAATMEANNYETALNAKYVALQADIKKYEQGLKYYNENGRELATELIINADKAFKNGEIDFLQYVQLLENAKNITLTYLENLLQYNMSVLEANYLID